MYEYKFNLTKNGELCAGILKIENDIITVTENGETVRTFNMTDYDELVLREGVGLINLELVKEGAGTVVAKGTMEYKNPFRGIVMMVKVYRKTGIMDEKYYADCCAICPKCGAPLRRPGQVCTKCVKKSKIFKRFIIYAGKHKWLLIMSVIFFFIATAAGLLGPYVNKILVDNYINNPEKAAIINSEPKKVLIGFLGVILATFGVTLLGYILNTIRNIILTVAGVSISVDLRDDVFDKVQHLSLSQIAKRTSGELIQRVSGDTSQVQNFICFQVPNIFEQIMMFIGVIVIILNYDWRLLLIVVLPTPIAIILIRLFRRTMHRIYGRQWRVSSQAGSVLYDIFSGIRVVKSYGTEEKEAGRYSDAAADERDIAIRNETFFAKFQPFVRFSLTLGTYFLLYYTGSKILGKTMTIGEASMFTSYVSLIYGPIGWLANLPRALERAFTSMVRLFDVLDDKGEIAESEKPNDFDIKGEISIKNIYFGYDKSEDVLKNVSFDIKPGEMIGLVGRSGVGKSTLINLIMRLYDVSEGSIEIDGVDIRNISQECLRSQIGVVLQETFLFAGSVYDNLLYAKPDAAREEIIEAAKLAGAHDFICRLPQGYNTRVGERGQTLSGGERQRVAIARAILRDPRILILDEATASLDTEIEKQIQDALHELAHKRTTIAIAHRLSTLRNADRIVVLDKGTVAEIGSHEELLRNKGIYYDLVMAQRNMSSMQHAN